MFALTETVQTLVEATTALVMRVSKELETILER